MSKEVVYRAGVIPYFIENDEIKMLFMKPSKEKFGGNKFQIAKGNKKKVNLMKRQLFAKLAKNSVCFLVMSYRKKILVRS